MVRSSSEYSTCSPTNADQPRKREDENETVGPVVEQPDWDAIADDRLDAESVSENGDLRYDEAASGELPEEDDDNPDQESDEALPDDDEERAIRRDMGGEAVRFEPE